MRAEYQLCIAKSGINMLLWGVFIAVRQAREGIRAARIIINLRRNQTGVKGQLIGQIK